MFGLMCGLGLSGLVQVEAEDDQDRVYQRRDRSGRTLYTNIGNLSEGGVRLAAMELRDLLEVDLSAVSQGELPELDRRIAMLHDATRSSGECAQIRVAAQDSVTELMWKEEQPEVLTCASLTGLTMVFGILGSGGLVSVLRLGLLVGSLSTGYDAASDAWARHEELSEGMRACSSELPASDPRDADAVRQRLSTASDFQRSVQGLFDAREGNIDAAASRNLR